MPQAISSRMWTSILTAGARIRTVSSSDYRVDHCGSETRKGAGHRQTIARSNFGGTGTEKSSVTAPSELQRNAPESATFLLPVVHPAAPAWPSLANPRSANSPWR